MSEKSSVKILVLDDDPFVLKLLGRILSNLGYTSVTFCDSGRAALEPLRRPAPISSFWISICRKWMGSSSCGIWSTCITRAAWC